MTLEKLEGEEDSMAECKFPFVPPSSMEQFMHQFFPPHPVKKEVVEEVSEDPCEGVFASHHEYSPEEHAATSSERDESPDTVSNSPDGGEEQEQKPQQLNDHLQQQLLVFQQALQAKMVSNGSISPSSDSSKRGSKIDNLAGNLAERLGQVSTSVSSPSLPSFPSAVSSILGHSAFQPQMGALSALAMQLAQNQSGGAMGMNSQSTPHQSVIQPNPSSLPSYLLPKQEQVQQLQQSQPSSGTTPQGFTQTPKRKRQRRNPVWPYFIVEDGVAKCKQCAYSTKSVFSTNLKVHLRSHHRPDYEKVIEAEDQLNLNALLLSGNAAAGLAGKDNRKRSLPPMTSSILMTISKLAAANQTSALQQALANQQAAAVAQMGGEGGGTENETLNALRQQIAANQINALQKQMQQQRNNEVSEFSPLGMARPNSAASIHQQTPPIVHSTPPTPSPAPTPDMILQQFGGLAGLQQGVLGGLEMPQPKRRRLRRHPVWMFFKDLEDRMVGCINCNFRTGSAFSTNLKMHLKAHHKEDYAKVLKLEDEMRIEEGIFGAPNKIKSELIDFIRGGGNANTPNAPCMSLNNSSASPLVQQLMAGGFNGRSSPHTPGSPSLRIPTITINNNSTIKSEGEEGFSALPMNDKLAALVGLHSLSGMENENGSDVEKAEKNDLIARLFNNPVQTQSLSMSALKAFNGSSVVTSDSKSCTSSSVDGSSIVYDDRKCERDRAVARFASAVGENVVSSHPFKVSLSSFSVQSHPLPFLSFS
ncbi:gei-13 [Pristionchus pacificus]|uniref:Gei-13 n=1 Tax=Pristionchus pacificus TaxID=54126 RepID=A0A2A6BAM1_PRIPA|nr:gei-13 [Pristionchus pacificus]|eukprot:PDM62939.1 gei-13 [Pristionchus pacificus]